MEKIHHPTYKLFGLLIVSVGAGIIAFVLSVGIAWYVFSKKDAVASLSATLSGMAEEEAYYLGLKRALADTEADRKLLDSYFADPENFVPLVEGIESLGTHAGVTVTIKSAALADANHILEISLSAGGSFPDILYFLSLLEASPAKISFDRAWIRKSATVAGGRIPVFPWEGNFTMKFASI